MDPAETDGGRRMVAAGGLTATAVAALTPLMAGVGFEGLGAVKGLLKRFFSEQAWGPADDEALADAVGSGDGALDVELAEGVRLVAGWPAGRFRLRVHIAAQSAEDPAAEPAAQPAEEPAAEPAGASELSATFRSSVVPEATPNPRTLRFSTAPGPVPVSESHRRGDPEVPTDARVAELFALSPAIVDVLVGPDFVAVSIDRADRWPALLPPVLAAVEAGFGDATDDDDAPDHDDAADPVRLPREPGAASPFTVMTTNRAVTALDRAWADLGGLRPARPGDLAQVLSAAGDGDPARRQVASSLLREAPAEAAEGAWALMVVDRSRRVRRAAVDAMVDVGRQSLRPLLEGALHDADAWVRWKALRGLAGLGAGPSVAAVEALRTDPDFRVRLEAANALRRSAP